MKINVGNILIIILIASALIFGGYMLFQKKIKPSIEKHLLEENERLTKENDKKDSFIKDLEKELIILQNEKRKISVVVDTKKIKELELELERYRSKDKIVIDTVSIAELEKYFKDILK